mmetsp:Transcript_12701/g.25924  ORF Transcript_12701/g.25924 Transcript_12701/m.25924 type:complete len:243 (-) Transcript_12701:875-1603(-)
MMKPNKTHACIVHSASTLLLRFCCSFLDVPALVLLFHLFLPPLSIGILDRLFVSPSLLFAHQLPDYAKPGISRLRVAAVNLRALAFPLAFTFLIFTSSSTSISTSLVIYILLSFFCRIYSLGLRLFVVTCLYLAGPVALILGSAWGMNGQFSKVLLEQREAPMLHALDGVYVPLNVFDPMKRSRQFGLHEDLVFNLLLGLLFPVGLFPFVFIQDGQLDLLPHTLQVSLYPPRSQFIGGDEIV